MDADAWDERYAATELMWSATPNRFVEQECADLAPGRAVDLAAGEGRNAIWLARRGWQVTAVDFSAVALDKGARLAGASTGPTTGGVEWVVGDATQWSAEQPVDLVLIAYLQLPAAERHAAVGRGFAALQPGGTFLLVAHDSSNLTEGTGGPQSPDVLYTANDVLTDLAGEAFDVVRAERVERLLVDHEGTETIAWDTLVRVVRRA